jgi:hypothetical protein
MKYIKLFEGIEQDIIDKDYIEMCFVDFIDEGNFRLYLGYDKKTCSITINTESTSNRDKRGTINDFKERSKLNYELFDKMEDCLLKVKLQYPNVQYKIFDHSGADEQEIRVDLALDTSASVVREPRNWFQL